MCPGSGLGEVGRLGWTLCVYCGIKIGEGEGRGMERERGEDIVKKLVLGGGNGFGLGVVL